MIDLSTTPRRAIAGSMLGAGLVGLAALVDLLIAHPFAGLVWFDVTYLVCAALVIVMGVEAWNEQPTAVEPLRWRRRSPRVRRESDPAGRRRRRETTAVTAAG